MTESILTPTPPTPAAAAAAIHVHVLDREGRGHEVEWLPKHSLMEALRDHGLPVLASCGGKAACATCHVFFEPEVARRLGERSQDEQELLDEIVAYDAGTSRLSCQVAHRDWLQGCVVRLAPEEE